MSASIGLVACGGGAAPTDTTAEGEGQVIDIVATDYEFEGAPEELTTGPVELSFSNEGEEPHMLIFAKLNEGSTLEDAIKAEGEAATNALVAAMQAGLPATSSEAMDAAEQARQHISRWFYDCPVEMHRHLGDMYVADERFTATYEKSAPGLALYVRDAIHANADRAGA